MSWRTLGLTIILNRVGSGDPCRSGRPVGAIVVGRLWRTSAGVRIGDSIRVLEQRYPYARRQAGGWWWLVVTRREVLGHQHPEPTLIAHVSSGRIDSLVAG